MYSGEEISYFSERPLLKKSAFPKREFPDSEAPWNSRLHETDGGLSRLRLLPVPPAPDAGDGDIAYAFRGCGPAIAPDQSCSVRGENDLENRSTEALKR